MFGSLELGLGYSLHFCSLFIFCGFINDSSEGTRKKISRPVLCQALEERLKQEQREEVHALKEAHRRTLDILRQQSEQELQTLRFELEDEGKAKLGNWQRNFQPTPVAALLMRFISRVKL